MTSQIDKYLVAAVLNLKKEGVDSTKPHNAFVKVYHTYEFVNQKIQRLIHCIQALANWPQENRLLEIEDLSCKQRVSQRIVDQNTQDNLEVIHTKNLKRLSSLLTYVERAYATPTL